jgi:molybdate transport system substrate-binding protein
MNQKSIFSIITTFAVCAVIVMVFVAGCTGTKDNPAAGAAPVAPSGKVTAYTAASLTGATIALGPAFEKAYPGCSVTFSLDGTQMLKEKVEQGAYADVFISASPKYTAALREEGYFINDTVKNLASNYVIVIIPPGNPGNILSLAELSEPGKKIAIGTKEVPIGIVTRTVIDNLANRSYNATWKEDLFRNVKTYETSEPGIVTKVSLGEVDAGFVYESSYKAAKAGTLNAIDIPKENNALQMYSIAVMRLSTNKPAAQAFEEFMLSSDGQKILRDYGFRPVS